MYTGTWWDHKCVDKCQMLTWSPIWGATSVADSVPRCQTWTVACPPHSRGSSERPQACWLACSGSGRAASWVTWVNLLRDRYTK